MKQYQIKVFEVFFFSLLAGVAMAQVDLPAEEVEVIKNFQARLADANKLGYDAILPMPDTTSFKYDYNVSTKVLDVNYLPPTIRPLGVKTEKLPPGYKGYVKAGYGYPSTPFAQVGYQFTDDNLNLGISARHLSSNNSSNRENQRFMDNDILLNGSYYTDNELAINGDLGFSSDNYYYYGYEADSANTFESSDVLRRFTTVDLGVNLFNGDNNDANFNYFAGFDAYRHGDNLAARETGFLIHLGASKWISEKHPLSLELKTDFTNYKDTIDYKLHNFNLLPSFTFHSSSFRIKVGVNLASHNDEYFFFPDAELALAVAGNQFVVFGGAEGDLHKNSFRTLTQANPFLDNRIDRIGNTKVFNYYAGLKGNVSMFNYEFKGGFKQAEGLALFYPKLESPVKYDVRYDNADIVYAQGTLLVNPTDQFELFFGILKNFYSLDAQEESWGLPSLEANAGVTYTALEDKLKIKLEAYVMDKIPHYLDTNQEVVKSNTLFDINVGADYFFTEKIGVFAQLNNLSSTQYRRWHLYPTLGINAIGGVMVRF